MAITIQHRRGTAAEWTAANPVLFPAEIGVETDTLKFKVGNGIAAWNALAYASPDGGATVETALGAILAGLTGAATQATLAALLADAQGKADGTEAEPARATGDPDQSIATVTVDTTAYGVGESLGGLYAFAGVFRAVGRGAILQRLSYLAPLDNLSVRAIVFRSAPGTAPTNHGVYSIANADRSFYVLDVALTKTASYGTTHCYTADLLASPCKNNVDTSARVVLINVSGTPTFTSTSGGTLIMNYTRE